MFYKVQDVKPLSEYKLLVVFRNGERKIYDVKPLFELWEPFRSLASDDGLFEKVRVDMGGYGIVWNDDIDLHCNELYAGGTSVQA